MERGGVFYPYRHLCPLLLVQVAVAIVLLTSSIRCSDAYDDYIRDDFPPDFVFGAGTSAYQYEGAAAEDGRTPSVWDTLLHQGMAMDGSTGDISSDGYHKYKEDVKLMNDIGLEAYRFSISWSRLIPNGRGAVNPKGLKYYNNVIDELIKHGIQPHICLSQLDLPQVLEDEYEGWLSPKIVEDFRAYADVCFREFGDRVSYWTTLNEPNTHALGAYDNGVFAPSRCSQPFGFVNCSAGNSTTEPYIALHNLLLAHAAVYELYKTKYKTFQKGLVGFNIYSVWFAPYTDTEEDVEATQRVRDFIFGWVLNPLVYGDYPMIMKNLVCSRLPSFTQEQTELVKGSYDFISLNHYLTMFVKDVVRPPGLRDYSVDMGVTFTFSRNETSSDVPGHFAPAIVQADPQGFEKTLGYIRRAYNDPVIYIQENGLGTPRNITIDDPERSETIKGYIGALLSSMRNGTDCRGYFVWSFVDAFEFIYGYQTRYGLHYVDFEDEKRARMPKKSALWYKGFLKKTNHLSIQSVGPLDGALEATY